MAEHDERGRSESTQTRTRLDNIQIGAAALSGAIYVGRTKKSEPGVWTDKRPAEAECFAAVIDHLQHGQSEPTPMAKTVSTDGGKTWWRVKVEPAEEADAPTPDHKSDGSGLDDGPDLPRATINMWRDPLMKKLNDAGCTQSQIAEAFGVSRQAVNAACARARTNT